MNVDLCYVLDCTGSIYSHIATAKDCIMHVVSYMKRTIKIRVGFCCYRDHCDGGGDGPEDVLGGINVVTIIYLEINPDETDCDTIDEQTGTFLHVKRVPAEKVIKEYLESGRKANSVERYLEAVEVSTIAHFLSKQFNFEAKRVSINKKVKFLQAKLLRGTSGSKEQFYTIEPNFRNAKYKRFNVNSGIITEFHSTLEALAMITTEDIYWFMIYNEQNYRISFY
ncbi:130_t:CDS:2 [Funneliformis geosporum]|nr:130_t:CDS:2 [Funneliformis geosporum]